mgnify:CR=1 FL=1
MWIGNSSTILQNVHLKLLLNYPFLYCDIQDYLNVGFSEIVLIM